MTAPLDARTAERVERAVHYLAENLHDDPQDVLEVILDALTRDGEFVVVAATPEPCPECEGVGSEGPNMHEPLGWTCGFCGGTGVAATPEEAGHE